MRSMTLAALAALLCLPAAAQYAEIGVTGGYSRFQDGEIAAFESFGGVREAYELGNGIRIGARMSFDFRGYFAHELAYSWQRAPFRVTSHDPQTNTTQVSETGSSIHNYYYNFVAHATRRDTRIRPFVTGGGGMSNFVPPGASALSSGQTKFGYNYGAGIKFLLSDRYGIRFDVRDHITSKPFFSDSPGRLHNVETSATFSFLF
jgi:opacity protein-like surface antigen